MQARVEANALKRLLSFSSISNTFYRQNIGANDHKSPILQYEALWMKCMSPIGLSDIPLPTHLPRASESVVSCL